MSSLRLTAVSLVLAFSSMAPLFATEGPTLVIRNHHFEPEELIAPAGQKFKLIVRNEDATPEEFESKTLKREKVVKGHGEIVMNLGPLEAGTYDFVGEFHEATAKGRLVVR
jgi:hypothetical protein